MKKCEQMALAALHQGPLILWGTGATNGVWWASKRRRYNARTINSLIARRLARRIGNMIVRVCEEK